MFNQLIYLVMDRFYYEIVGVVSQVSNPCMIGFSMSTATQGYTLIIKGADGVNYFPACTLDKLPEIGVPYLFTIEGGENMLTSFIGLV